MKLSMKLPPTTMLLFIGGAVVFALAVFQALSLPPLRQEIKTTESGYFVLKQKNEKLSEILSQIKTLESNLDVVQAALPVADEVPALIMQLEQIAKQSGLTVQHLGFGGGEGAAAPRASEASREAEEKEATEVKKVLVTMVVTGSYPSLQTFLQNLENASRVVNVTNFKFSPGQKEEEAALSITLGVEAFYLPEAADVSTETPLTLDTASKEYIDLIRKVKALRVYRSEVSE